jgi:sigma-B regulation protein RsbU (phosphoserine phosphatase)
MKIEKGDSLVLFTDGIPEAMDVDGNLFGDPRLEALLSGFNIDHSPKSITKKLLEETKSFESGAEQSDDITILVLTYYFNFEAKKQNNKMFLEIENNVEEIAKVNTLIDQACETWDINPANGHKITLALEEIVSNIINYGFADEAKHLIGITIERIEGAVRIVVEDEGTAFNPLEMEEPDSLNKPIEEREVGGLGIYFVKQFMDHKEYRREEGKNILILEKRI